MASATLVVFQRRLPLYQQAAADAADYVSIVASEPANAPDCVRLTMEYSTPMDMYYFGLKVGRLLAAEEGGQHNG